MSGKLLALPVAGANRVYGADVPRLLGHELRFMGATLGGIVVDHRVVSVGGVDYVELSTDRDPTGDELRLLSNASGLHALFRGSERCLRPVGMAPVRRYDDRILTIQRYPGKTNERFTQLLVNVTLAAAGDAFARMGRGERVTLLDPASGRGTTLNQAVVYGLDCCGIERSRRDVEAYEAFILRWLRDMRVKHDVERSTRRRKKGPSARSLTITYGYDRHDRAAGRTIRVVNDDLLLARDHCRARTADAVVADLPYGVQHRAHGPDGAGRSPVDLVTTAAPLWRELLRPHGAVGLAWNRRTASRRAIVDALVAAGFVAAAHTPDDAFVHDVDRSITRDLVVATRS